MTSFDKDNGPYGDRPEPQQPAYPPQQPYGEPQQAYGQPQQAYGQPPATAPPAYGAPAGYGDPSAPPPYGNPYGPGGAYPPGTYGRSQQTNTLAIVALVLTFVCSLAGLITGIIAQRQIRESGEGGAGLAKAAVIISGIFVGLTVLYFVFIIVLAATGGFSSSTY